MNQIEAREKLQEMEEGFELFCDLYKHQAKTLWVIYGHLIDEGFTAEQALDIIKARGATLY